MLSSGHWSHSTSRQSIAIFGRSCDGWLAAWAASGPSPIWMPRADCIGSLQLPDEAGRTPLLWEGNLPPSWSVAASGSATGIANLATTKLPGPSGDIKCVSLTRLSAAQSGGWHTGSTRLPRPLRSSQGSNMNLGCSNQSCLQSNIFHLGFVWRAEK